MSYMKATCPKCGASYWFGVVGTQFIGGHACPKDKP